MNIIKKIALFICFCCLIPLFWACSDDDDASILKNDCIKWTIGPNVVGTEIEFTYAMAMPYNSGKIIKAEVEASIEGAEGTWMEHNSYYTDREGGTDVPVLVGSPSVTSNAKTTVEFVVDTCAAALRYYYKIPEIAKGKTVSFTFTAYGVGNDGVNYNISYKMGPYQISSMDMVLDLTLSRNNCFISIEDMTIYDADQAASNASKIDLVYLFRNYKEQGIEFQHAFVSPGADPMYLPDVVLPTGVNNISKIRKGGPTDAHLARLDEKEPVPEKQPGVYVDDVDFTSINLSGMPNYALDVRTYDGLWVETQDGKYRAYIYANNMRNITGGTISMKRYTMK